MSATESKQNRVSLSSQIPQFWATVGLASLPEGFIGPIFKCYKHPETLRRAACRKITLHQALIQSFPWTTQTYIQNLGTSRPQSPGSPSNQGESHRVSGIDRHGGHLLQVPSDTLIPTHHFYGTLKGSRNSACTCTDTYKPVCTHTFIHSLSRLPCPPGQFAQCESALHRLRGLLLIESFVSPKLLPTPAN